ncbi:MAG TPA: PQQ-binding-like beta-propeller repeat protein [Gemmataceae bacterium]|nr:PQQ-binding-like beta-propeller repeat protein [Gemmataceae bacterium]
MVLAARAGFTLVFIFPLILAVAVHAEDWPQWRGPNRDGVWSESGILQTFPPHGLKIRWRAAVGIGFSSPVVAGGRVFVTDSELAKPKARERVHAFDAATGKPLWSYTYDVNYPDIAFDEKYLRGPIATPVAADGRIYTLGASGNVFCLEAVKGSVLWRKDLLKEYPGSDLCPSPSPLIEGDLLILLVGAKPGASVIALNKHTGKHVWKALDEGATASSPVVITSAGTRQLIVWTDRSVTALAPATGNTLWRQQLNTTQDAAVSTPVYHDGYLLIGGLMMKLDQNKPGAVILWPQSRATARRVLSDTSTALFRDDHIYSARSFGEFVCLDAKTGKQLWETDKVTDRKSGASVHPTVIGGSVLLYNDGGELIRAQVTSTGYHEVSRARVLEPAVTFSGRKCAWAAPAYANRHIYARTNRELVCASLATEP